MPAKVAFSLGLAALFPAASFVAIRLDAPSLWLGAFDFLLVAILFIVVSHNAQIRNAGKKSLVLGLGALLLTALIFRFAPTLLIYLPAIVISLVLARVFYSTLAPGKEPAITRFARIERGGKLPDELCLYTRRLTWAWTVFFLAITLECLILAAFAPIQLYLLFANTLNPLFVAAFFSVEYVYRRFRYRHHPHPSLLRLIQTVASGNLLAARKKITYRPHVNADLRSRFVIPHDHPCLAGHFPDNPIVPGVVILDEVAGLLAQMQPENRIVRVVQAKFLSILRPDEICEICFSPSKVGSMKFECHAGGRLIAGGALIVSPERGE